MKAREETNSINAPEQGKTAASHSIGNNFSH